MTYRSFTRSEHRRCRVHVELVSRSIAYLTVRDFVCRLMVTNESVKWSQVLVAPLKLGPSQLASGVKVILFLVLF